MLCRLSLATGRRRGLVAKQIADAWGMIRDGIKLSIAVCDTKQHHIFLSVAVNGFHDCEAHTMPLSAFLAQVKLLTCQRFQVVS